MSKRLNKAQILEHIANESEVSLAQAIRMLNAFTDLVTHSLANDIEVGLVGFGTFSSPHRNEVRRRNPRTGEPVVVPAKRVPRFRPSKNLIQACIEMNANG